MGVRTVINLRTRHGEKEAVEAAGMRYVEIPMNVWKNVDPAAVRKALSVVTDPANQPVFVHCSRGADRTGVVAAVYRVKVFGFHKFWSQFREFVRWYPENRKGIRGGSGP